MDIDELQSVHLLFDCDTLVSAHRTAAGAEAARVAHQDRVRAEMGERWLPFHDEQIEVIPIDVQS